jgi:tetratricopeptide (TPR) repeat protein
MYSKDTVPLERFKEENMLAEEAITAGKLSEAAAILVKIVEIDPENWRAFNNMGILSWSQKSWDDAYTMFRKSVALRPDYADALVNLFDAALKLKKISEVAACFEQACSINPEMEEITVLRNSIREQGEEIYHTKRALSIGIYNPAIEAAKKELDSGNLFAAMDIFLKVNDREGPSAEAYCGLGIISFYQERYEDAVVLFIESIKLNPMDTDTYLNLFDAAKVCDKLHEAQVIFDTYRKEFSELAVLDDYFSHSLKKD